MLIVATAAAVAAAAASACAGIDAGAEVAPAVIAFAAAPDALTTGRGASSKAGAPAHTAAAVTASAPTSASMATVVALVLVPLIPMLLRLWCALERTTKMRRMHPASEAQTAVHCTSTHLALASFTFDLGDPCAIHRDLIDMVGDRFRESSIRTLLTLANHSSACIMLVESLPTSRFDSFKQVSVVERARKPHQVTGAIVAGLLHFRLQVACFALFFYTGASSLTSCKPH